MFEDKEHEITIMYTNKTKNKTNNYYGVSHSKLWLIKFEDRLRIVICSANLTKEDFEVWGQVFWYQDFYIKSIKIG